MSNRAINWCWKIKLPPTEKLVLQALCDTCDASDQSFQSKKRLAALCCVSEKTVGRALKSITDLGLIEPRNRFINGKQLSNNYLLHIDKSLPDGLKIVIPSRGDNMSPYNPQIETRPRANNVPPDQNQAAGGTSVSNRGDTQGHLGGTSASDRGDTGVHSNPYITPPVSPTEPLQQGKKPSRVSVTGPTWEAYAAEYSARYGAPPERNASVNGKLAQFINRVGAENAPAIAEFFVTLNERWYIQRMHQVGDLLSNAEKIATQWRTGRVSTQQAAQEQERQQTQRANFQAAAQNLKDRGLWQ